MRAFYIYILASRKNGTLYTGVTSNLSRRAWEHREGLNEGFTKRAQRQTTRLYRRAPDGGECHQTRESHQILAAPLEDRTHREGQSALVRSVPAAELVKVTGWSATC